MQVRGHRRSQVHVLANPFEPRRVCKVPKSNEILSVSVADQHVRCVAQRSQAAKRQTAIEHARCTEGYWQCYSVVEYRVSIRIESRAIKSDVMLPALHRVWGAYAAVIDFRTTSQFEPHETSGIFSVFMMSTSCDLTSRTCTPKDS
jgi:hypothetical protein